MHSTYRDRVNYTAKRRDRNKVSKLMLLCEVLGSY